MADPYIGEIRMVTFNFAPRGWATCNGQLVDIGQFASVFAVLGIYYGGDGNRTFGLPNLQARLPVGAGTGIGLTQWDLGMSYGIDQLALQGINMDHGHIMRGNSTDDGATSPEGNVLGVTAGGENLYAASASPIATLHNETVSTAPGGGGVHENRMPFQCLNYVICMDGLWPERDN